MIDYGHVFSVYSLVSTLDVGFFSYKEKFYNIAYTYKRKYKAKQVSSLGILICKVYGSATEKGYTSGYCNLCLINHDGIC